MANFEMRMRILFSISAVPLLLVCLIPNTLCRPDEVLIPGSHFDDTPPNLPSESQNPAKENPCAGLEKTVVDLKNEVNRLKSENEALKNQTKLLRQKMMGQLTVSSTTSTMAPTTSTTTSTVPTTTSTTTTTTTSTTAAPSTTPTTTMAPTSTTRRTTSRSTTTRRTTTHPSTTRGTTVKISTTPVPTTAAPPKLESHESHNSKGNGTQKVYTCEYTNLSFGCDIGSIQVMSAIYGHVDDSLCKEHIASKFPNYKPKQDPNCKGKPSDLTIVQKICNSQSNCVVPASNAKFGDPCVNTFKYLQIEYTCV